MKSGGEQHKQQGCSFFFTVELQSHRYHRSSWLLMFMLHRTATHAKRVQKDTSWETQDSWQTHYKCGAPFMSCWPEAGGPHTSGFCCGKNLRFCWSHAIRPMFGLVCVCVKTLFLCQTHVWHHGCRGLIVWHKLFHPDCHGVLQKLLVASLLLVVRLGAPGSVLAPSSDALCS